MFPLRFERPRRSENGEVVGFRSTAGENDFARLRTKKFRSAVARVVEQRPRFSADVMHGRRIAPNFAEKRQHRVAHAWVKRGRGVVIEVNRSRHRHSL